MITTYYWSPQALQTPSPSSRASLQSATWPHDQYFVSHQCQALCNIQSPTAIICDCKCQNAKLQNLPAHTLYYYTHCAYCSEESVAFCRDTSEHLAWPWHGVRLCVSKAPRTSLTSLAEMESDAKHQQPVLAGTVLRTSSSSSPDCR